MASQIPRWASQSPSSSAAQAPAASAASRRADTMASSGSSHSPYAYSVPSQPEQQSIHHDELPYDDFGGPFAQESGCTLTPFATASASSAATGADTEAGTETGAVAATDRSTSETRIQSQQQPPSSMALSSSSPAEDAEPRRCWICYSDETEDPSPKPEWRSPCPCNLTAHEACLLDWLADIETSGSRRRLRRGKLQCPQCKSEIVVRRPRNLAVELVRKADVLAGKMVAPGLAFSFVSMVWAGCCLHGLYSFRMVFGAEAAHRVLMTGDGLLRRTRTNLGMPLIPIILIFSRTRFADRSLPVFPVLFFAMRGPEARSLENAQLWPPSASLTFASLPYIRSLYNLCYDRVFGRLERKWMMAVRPRAGETEDGDGNGNDGDDEVENIVGWQVQIQLNLANQNRDEDEEDEEEEQDNAALMPLRHEHDVVNGDMVNGDRPNHAAHEQPPQPQDGDQRQEQQQAQQEDQQEEAQAADADAAAAPAANANRDDIFYGTLADTVLGALAFPAISASMGTLLKALLPRHWTTPIASKTPRPNLLQTRWGRSVVGGCLFVLLKDVVRLYCRWKIAQSHRKRRVLNYDRRLKRVVS